MRPGFPAAPLTRCPRRQGPYVQAHEEMVTGLATIQEALVNGQKNRHIGCTNMNEKSSRSHTIFRIVIESKARPRRPSDASTASAATGANDSSISIHEDEEDEEDGAVLVSSLSLVDLAGSENVRHTGAEGTRLREAGNINKSLLTLSRVIAALAAARGDAAAHINFRDSKLTRILQPSLAGNTRTAIICCCTPAETYREETRSTLQFAARAKAIKTHASVNERVDDATMLRRLKRKIRELEDEARAQREANASAGQESVLDTSAEGVVPAEVVAEKDAEMERVKAEKAKVEREKKQLDELVESLAKEREREAERVSRLKRLILGSSRPGARKHRTRGRQAGGAGAEKGGNAEGVHGGEGAAGTSTEGQSGSPEGGAEAGDGKCGSSAPGTGHGLEGAGQGEGEGEEEEVKEQGASGGETETEEEDEGEEEEETVELDALEAEFAPLARAAKAAAQRRRGRKDRRLRETWCPGAGATAMPLLGQNSGPYGDSADGGVGPRAKRRRARLSEVPDDGNAPDRVALWEMEREALRARVRKMEEEGKAREQEMAALRAKVDAAQAAAADREAVTEAHRATRACLEEAEQQLSGLREAVEAEKARVEEASTARVSAVERARKAEVEAQTAAQARQEAEKDLFDAVEHATKLEEEMEGLRQQAAAAESVPHHEQGAEEGEEEEEEEEEAACNDTAVSGSAGRK